MNLLLDQNLSPRLCAALADLFGEVVHVRDAGLAQADDQAVWEHAKATGSTIVTKDSDFHQRSFMYGHPPRVVWVRLGNCSTNDIEQLLRRHHSTLIEFHLDDEASLIALP